jgi:hypothetical protein
MEEFEHEIAMQENGVDYNDLPTSIKGKINEFKKSKGKVYADPENVDPEQELYLQKKSLVIAEDIQDWVERDLPDEETLNNQNMDKAKEALIARAKAAGLPDTATEAEIAAKETEIANDTKKANAIKERAIAAGLAETATEAEVEAKETEIENGKKGATALKDRAKAAGLKEDATEAEIQAAEAAAATKALKTGGKTPVPVSEDGDDGLGLGLDF